jgi:formylglycine-generating enzyme required for sulfatase activity
MEFCYVPARPFRVGEGKKGQVNRSLSQGYWIGRYPITVAQYGWFVREGGYRQRELWGEAEVDECWREGKFKGGDEEEWTEGPRAVGFPFDLANHPMVGVSWYEALAFCSWLTGRWRSRLPVGCRVLLPSEAAWGMAARGGQCILREPIRRAVAQGLSLVTGQAEMPNPSQDRAYPWGDDFDANRVNSRETGIEATTAVGVFPGGQAPCGAMEMSGNVWEWCREGGVLRGGSWSSDRDDVRCAHRNRYFWDHRPTVFGFRVVVSPF